MPFFWDNNRFCLDDENLVLTDNGVQLELKQQEFRILIFLLKRRGRLVKHEEIRNHMEAVGYDVSGKSNVSKMLVPIRKHLKSSSCRIDNRKNLGYVFLGEVLESDDAVPSATATENRLPFVVGSVPSPSQFVGRSLELRRIFRRVENGESVAIVGDTGLGKTSLLHHVKGYHDQDASKAKKRHLDHPENIVWIHVDFRHEHFHKKDSFYELAIEALGGMEDRTGNLAGDFAKLLSDHPMRKIFLLDHLDKAFDPGSELDNGFWEGLRACASDRGVSIITCSRTQPSLLLEQQGYTSPIFNYFLVLKLKPFSDDELEELFDLESGLFDDDEKTWVSKKSNRIPAEALRYCHLKWEAVEDGLHDDSWQIAAE